MLTYFMYFLIYSFAGFLLETGYSLLAAGTWVSKKCLVFSLLCPVYGFGSLAILGSTRNGRAGRAGTFWIGMLAATAVEYGIAFLYERVLSVHIWDYSNLPFNIKGRVCLIFSLFWGALSLLLVYVVHPRVRRLVQRIPQWTRRSLLLIFVADAVFSALVLRRFGSKRALNLFWLLRQVTR